MPIIPYLPTNIGYFSIDPGPLFIQEKFLNLLGQPGHMPGL